MGGLRGVPTGNRGQYWPPKGNISWWRGGDKVVTGGRGGTSGPGFETNEHGLGSKHDLGWTICQVPRI